VTRSEFAVLAVVAFLLLAGCTGGSPAEPGTATEASAETTATTTTTTTHSETRTTVTTATTTGKTTTSTDGSATVDETNGSGIGAMFDSIGVARNYSSGGDLDAKQVARAHLLALNDVESVTVQSTTRTRTGDRSSVLYSRTERNATHLFHRQNGSMNVTIYDGPERKVMKVAGENGPEYVRLGDGNESRQTEKSGSSPVLQLAKLQTMPYEKVGTVERNGTTLTKYEATGPGYYAVQEDLTVESFDSTLLVDASGLVRYFHHEVTYRRDGENIYTETTLRYVSVGTTDVTMPEWLDEVRKRDDRTDKSEDSGT
jgi:hypothetical protein